MTGVLADVMIHPVLGRVSDVVHTLDLLGIDASAMSSMATIILLFLFVFKFLILSSKLSKVWPLWTQVFLSLW